MSSFNICLFLLAVGLWVSIFIVRFWTDITEWLLNRYGKSEPPPPPPDGKMPDVQLPFRYETPQATQDAPDKDAPDKDAPDKDAPDKDAPDKETEVKDAK